MQIYGTPLGAQPPALPLVCPSYRKREELSRGRRAPLAASSGEVPLTDPLVCGSMGNRGRGGTSAARSARSRCRGEQASPTEKPREPRERVPRGKGADLRARQRAERVKCRATLEALNQQRGRGARPKGCTKPPLLCLTHRAERGRLCTKARFCGEGAMRPRRAERATGAQPPNGQPDGAVPRPAAVLLGVPFRAGCRAHASRWREGGKARAVRRTARAVARHEAARTSRAAGPFSPPPPFSTILRCTSLSIRQGLAPPPPEDFA